MRLTTRCALATLGVFWSATTPEAATAPSVVTVQLQDPSTGHGVTRMQIEASPDRVPRGQVIFRIRNELKSLVHEMLLIKPPPSEQLPYDAKTQRVIESESNKLEDSGDIQPGGLVTTRTTLRPSSYLMICNQPGHYAAGMRRTFIATR